MKTKAIFKISKEPVEKQTPRWSKFAQLLSMEVGDSFLMPKEERYTMYQFAYRNKVKVESWKEGDSIRVKKV
jgi:hypothetical protein